MADFPPMPKPEEFGISLQDWQYENTNDPAGYGASRRIAAYQKALETWKEVMNSIAGRGTTGG